MNTKEVFTKKRMAAVAEAYQLLQQAVNEVREAFIGAAKDEEHVVYWPLFDLHLLKSIQKVATPGDTQLHATTREQLRAMAFLAYGEEERIDVTLHLTDTDEVIRLALSGENPSEVGRKRRMEQVEADREARARLKEGEEAERGKKLTPVEIDALEQKRLLESRRNTTYRDIEKTIGFPRR